MAEEQLRLLKRALRKKGMIRTHEAEDLGIERSSLSRLVNAGSLLRIERGLYTLPEANHGQHHSLAIVSKRVPQGIICLISALAFHEMTTEIPRETWLALPPHSHPPQIGYPSLAIVYISEPSASHGVETHHVDKVPVRITNPARTVADCFKFRNKVGIDVALSALKDYWHNKLGTLVELRQATDICRVTRVVQPYLEAIIS